MSDILERAKAHFKTRRETDMDYIDVPEWGEGDKPLRIFWRPMNLAENNQIFKYAKNGDLEAMAQTLIVRALDEDGNRLFRPVHKTELMKHVDAKIIERIVLAMGGDDDDVEEAEKN